MKDLLLRKAVLKHSFINVAYFKISNNYTSGILIITKSGRRAVIAYWYRAGLWAG
jgi:hypothetical protein